MLTAERLTSAVRVHADRVHDAVRRLGASPEEAVRVVEDSGLALVSAVAADPQLADPVGWWFARARSLVPNYAGAGTGVVPVGGGVLAADGDQALLSRALEGLPEQQRLALLLRDSYDLPATTVGTALDLTPDGAMELVGRARLAFLPAVDPEPVPSLGGHGTDPAALARIAEGGQVAARDATVRRHAQACATCRAVVDAQDYAHRLLAGLVVVALPEREREPVLTRVEGAARAALPAPAAVVLDEDGVLVEEDEDLPRRLLSPLGVLLALVAAVALGVGLGLLLSRDPAGIDPEVASRGLPLVTAPALPEVGEAPPEQLARVQSPAPPETRVFEVEPRFVPPPPPPPPPPTPTLEPSPTPPPAVAALSLDPASGPDGATVRVSGSGFRPGAAVVVEYFAPDGTSTGSAVSATADDAGGFVVDLVAEDPTDQPGPHPVRATADDGQSATATYEVVA